MNLNFEPFSLKVLFALLLRRYGFHFADGSMEVLERKYAAVTKSLSNNLISLQHKKDDLKIAQEYLHQAHDRLKTRELDFVGKVGKFGSLFEKKALFPKASQRRDLRNYIEIEDRFIPQIKSGLLDIEKKEERLNSLEEEITELGKEYQRLETEKASIKEELIGTSWKGVYEAILHGEFNKALNSLKALTTALGLDKLQMLMYVIVYCLRKEWGQAEVYKLDYHKVDGDENMKAVFDKLISVFVSGKFPEMRADLNDEDFKSDENFVIFAWLNLCVNNRISPGLGEREKALLILVQAAHSGGVPPDGFKPENDLEQEILLNVLMGQKRFGDMLILLGTKPELGEGIALEGGTLFLYQTYALYKTHPAIFENKNFLGKIRNFARLVIKEPLFWYLNRDVSYVTETERSTYRLFVDSYRILGE